LAKRFSEHFHASIQELLKSNVHLFPENPSQENPQRKNYFAAVENRQRVIQKAFNATKNEFKLGMASFLTLYRSEYSNKIYGFCAGDCRLGLLNNKSIQWLSPVHTGANFSGENFEIAMKLMPERHVLTKSLNLRRNFEPEEFELVVSTDDVFIVATDGFWMELNEAQQQSFINEPGVFIGDKSLVDDTSVLLITWSDLGHECKPKFECNLTLELTLSSNNSKTVNDNLLVINSRSSQFGGNANIAAMSTKTGKKNEY
jgi:serine/threonine protein phosphatase PrpC